MAFLQESDKAVIKERLSEMRSEVTLRYFTQDIECEFCRETHELLQELSALDDKIKLEVFDFTKNADEAGKYKIDKIPATVVMNSSDFGIRFYGIPAGYEFPSLLEAIVMVSQGESSLSQESKNFLKELKSPVHLQVFVTPTWPYCPAAVRLAQQAAMENELITADAVEISEFPHLAQKYKVMGVPKTVINENFSIEGSGPESMLMAKIREATKA
jgi:glutaredoxin-like protein